MLNTVMKAIGQSTLEPTAYLLYEFIDDGISSEFHENIFILPHLSFNQTIYLHNVRRTFNLFGVFWVSPWLRQASSELKNIVNEVDKCYGFVGTSSSYKVQKLHFAK